MKTGYFCDIIKIKSKLVENLLLINIQPRKAAFWGEDWAEDIMNEQEIRVLLNQMLKDMFYKILRLQEKSVSQSANITISRTEMHILEVIQDEPDATLTRIADMLGVTKATASVSVKRLTEKNYLQKAISEYDKRKSILKLTEGGELCCRKHRQFHDMMIESLLRDFRIEEYPDLLKSLEALRDFFSRLEH